MKLVTNLSSNAEDEAQEEDIEEDASTRKEEGQRNPGWLERSAVRVEYSDTPQHQKSQTGLVVTGLSHLKPVLLTRTSNADTDSANQTLHRLLEILGFWRKTNITAQQQHQQRRDVTDLSDPVPSGTAPDKSAFWKVPPSSVKTYVSQLLAKPKLRDDLLVKMASMGVKGLSKTDVEGALRKILDESSKADKDMRRRSSIQPSLNRAGYGYQSRGRGGETVGTAGKGLDLFVVGDQVYPSHSQLDSNASLVHPKPTQNLASSRPERTSPRSRFRGAHRVSVTSGGRRRHRRMSRRTSRERKRGNSAEEKTSKDSKKRKLSAASTKTVGLPETVDRRRISGSGSEATSGYQNLHHRLSKGPIDKMDEVKPGASQSLYKEKKMDAPSDLTKEVASGLPGRPPASASLKDSSAGDLPGPATRSHTPMPGSVSATTPSQGRWADVVAGKDAGQITTATPQVTSPGTAGLPVGVRKDVPGRRPASSPVKKAVKGQKGSQRSQTARSKATTIEEVMQFSGSPPVTTQDHLVGSKQEDTRKVLVRGRSGKRRGMSMQSSSNSRPWVGPTNEEETEYNKKPTLLAPGSGSASQRDPERDPASAAERDPRSAADHVPKSDSNKLSQGKGRQKRKDFGPKHFAPPANASVGSSTGVFAYEETMRSRQDGEGITRSNDNNPTKVADDVEIIDLAETGPTVTRLDSMPSEARFKTWSTPSSTGKKSPVVAPPLRGLFLARGDHYGLPEKGYELTRAFVFSYFQRMPPHYVDFKKNPPILITRKKKKKN